MPLGLVVFVLFGRASGAQASCGYYVIIGHPSPQTAAEQATLGRGQMPLEHRQCPCNGPQCRGQDRPMTPPMQALGNSVQDPITGAVGGQALGEIDFGTALIEEISILSDPHIWRSDPPPR